MNTSVLLAENSSLERKASCGCGYLSLTLTGDPSLVAVCNCTDCQRRTGSVFGVSSFFHIEQIKEKSGKSSLYSKNGDAEPESSSHFCPRCGTTVFWYPEFLEDHIGVAVGCFADPEFPEPQLVGWCSSKHDWVTFPEAWPSSQTQDY